MFPLFEVMFRSNVCFHRPFCVAYLLSVSSKKFTSESKTRNSMENKNNRSCLAMFEKSLKSNILHRFRGETSNNLMYT